MKEKPHDSFYFVIETVPKSKPRARSNGKVRFYAADYEAFIQDSHGQLSQQWRGEAIDRTVVLDVLMHGWHKGSDLDNLHGAVQDSLVRAKILKNDNLNNIDDFHAAWCKAENQRQQRIEIWVQVDKEKKK